MTRFAASLIAVVVVASTSSAWSKPGHMVTGAIAYQLLQKSDPQVAARAVGVLKAHPQYEKLWKPKLDTLKSSNPDADLDEYLFMLAARWSDDIRQTEYDRPTWHYITNPFTPDPNFRTDAGPDPKGNALKGIADNLKLAQDGPEDLDRAVPLCWLFHLVGDVQMPLHTVSLFSTTYPTGDLGGNRFYVKVTPDGRPINLHYFWDGLITNTDSYTTAHNLAIELRNRPEFAADKLVELEHADPEYWCRVESPKLAREAVYLNGKLEGGPTEAEARVLPEGYAKAAKAVGERRGVLAGYRLAATLRLALPSPPAPAQSHPPR